MQFFHLKLLTYNSKAWVETNPKQEPIKKRKKLNFSDLNKLLFIEVGLEKFGLAKILYNSLTFSSGIPIPESQIYTNNFKNYFLDLFFFIVKVIFPFEVNLIELLIRFINIYLSLYSSP